MIFKKIKESRARNLATPFKCWEGYKRDYSKTEFSDGSCVKSPAKLTDEQYNKKNTKMRTIKNLSLINKQVEQALQELLLLLGLEAKAIV